MSGVRRVLANLAHLLGGKVAAGVISLGYLVLATHMLGARDYGVLVLVNAYAVLIGSVIAFSGFHGVVRYGAIALEAGDAAGFARLIRFMTMVELTAGLVAILIAAMLVPLVGPRLGWSDDAMRVALPYSIAVIATVRATPQGLLQVARRFDLLGLHQVVSPVVRMVGSGMVWAYGGGLVGFLSVWLAAAVAEGAAMWLLGLIAWRQLKLDQPLKGPWRGVLRDTDGFGRFILVTNFDITLRELAPNLAPLTVGWLLGPAAAGLLALAQRATSLFSQPAVLLSQASYAVLAEQVARRDFRLLRNTVWRSAALALLVAVPFVALFMLLGERLLVLIGGTSFVGGTGLLILVAAGRAVGLGAAPLGAGLIALGKPQRSVTVALMANLALYPLLPLLLSWIGVNGAGWHLLIQNMIATTALAMFFATDAKDGRP